MSPDQNNEVEGVQFETDSYKAVKFYDQADAPKIITWIRKSSGDTVTEKQAGYILFGLAILAIFVSLFLFFNTRKGPGTSLPPGAKIIYPPNAPPRLAEPVLPPS